MDKYDIIAAVALFLISLVLLISVLANSAILFVFYKDEKTRVPSSTFVVSMAITGLLGAGVFAALAPSLLSGQMLFTVSKEACLAREFFNELFTCANLLSLLLVTANRYGVVVLKHRYKAFFSNRRCLVFVALSWIIAFGYAGNLTVFQLKSTTSFNDFKCSESYNYPSHVAAIQFTFQGIPFTAILALNGALAFSFYQQRNNLPLPLKFYSKDSMKRRMAPGKTRRITKNLRVLTISVTSLLVCFAPLVACLMLAMFTGKCPKIAYGLSVTMAYMSCLLHPYLYGYLNRRLKLPLQRLAKRMCNRLLCRHGVGEAQIVRRGSSLAFHSSKLSRTDSNLSFSKLRMVMTDETVNSSGIEQEAR